MTFRLDSRLAEDTLWVATRGFCEWRLMNQAAVPWLVLVPHTTVTEWHHLPPEKASILWQETLLAARLLERLFTPAKMNLGALGNIVNQLHVHIVARDHQDPAWPGPVWGQLPAAPYSPHLQQVRLEAIRQALAQEESSPHEDTLQ